MTRCRLFEQAIAKLWDDGLILGEMHLGTGEEAIIAGTVSQLQDGDAMALDHRGTAAMIARGVDPALILRELLGRPDGLCRGMGGHMHLFSREHLAASSGIVGAEGPAAVGFALAARYSNPGAIAVAFFGEGAVNQGMLMESMNLASAWRLPVLFVCKDDGWAITTRPEQVNGADLSQRARGFGIPAVDVDGRDVSAVWDAANEAIARARAGSGPTFIHARCVHLEAHFLGFQLKRAVQNPLREIPPIALPLARSLLLPRGAPAGERIAGLKKILTSLLDTARDSRTNAASDPLHFTREKLKEDTPRLLELEDRVAREVAGVVETALAEVPS